MSSPEPPENLPSHPRRGPDLTSFQLGAIAALCSDGNSIRMIAHKLGIPKSTVGDAVKKAPYKTNKEGEPKRGRPRVLSERTIRAIKRDIEQDPKVSYSQLITQNNLTCSIATLRSAMKADGIEKRIAKKRPQLTEEQANARL